MKPYLTPQCREDQVCEHCDRPYNHRHSDARWPWQYCCIECEQLAYESFEALMATAEERTPF